MKALLPFTLIILLAAALSQRLPAQNAFVPALTHMASAGGERAAPIPLDQIGATAGGQYSGDGLSVCATAGGARLRCVFQKMEGEVTREGLWLTSTAVPSPSKRFRVMARSVGRGADFQPSGSPNCNRQGVECATALDCASTCRLQVPPAMAGANYKSMLQLKSTGTVEVAGKVARFLRPGLVEEYSVSMDGVQQDFIIERRPEGEGALRVELAVTGAKAEQLAGGARLVLDGSGRTIAYSRLHVTDATGRELPARVEVHSEARIPNSFEFDFAVAVNDSGAVYPVRIDPTFSDANWISMGGIPGVDGPVYAAVVDGEGNLYIGGSFTAAGDILANSVAKWDGSSWSALGSGVMFNGFDGDVRALAVTGSDLYAGGFFTTAGGVAATNIAKWNGSSWSALGSGIQVDDVLRIVYALAVSGTDLYAGGNFTMVGGNAATNIAKWNGSTWSALGSGMDGEVRALAVAGGDLYAGGRFTNAAGIPVNRIAKWNGSSWSALGSGVNGFFPRVDTLAVSGTDLYAGGIFTNAGGNRVSSIAKWNGSFWSALGSGIGGVVYALAASGTDLYVGGDFIVAGGVNGVMANGIAKWNGSSWVALSSGANVLVRALVVSGSDLYAGGDFTTVGANGIAKWNGSSWVALASGINGLGALAVSGSDLYVWGQFTTAGSGVATNIAKWNGSSWSAVASGINGGVGALAVSGSDLYVGGNFRTAGGVAATNIAKWNGSSWSTLGSGLNSTVSALAVSGSNLYAGGRFTNAGGIPANRIAKWDGSSWSALGSGIGNDIFSYVSALAVSGSNLYAGGSFTDAGGIAANHIAKWDGNAWSALGSGISNAFPLYVNALAISGSDLYAGGQFTAAGGIAARYIAKWDGSSWSPLGSGFNNPVQVLAMSGSELYAGGRFTISKWNGSSWSALGSGMNREVRALAVSGSDLYAAGEFSIAGGKVSGYVARARIGSIAEVFVAANSTVSIQFSGVTGYEYDVQRATNLSSSITWTTVTTNPLSPSPDGSFTFTDTNAPPGTAYYRAAKRDL